MYVTTEFWLPLHLEKEFFKGIASLKEERIISNFSYEVHFLNKSEKEQKKTSKPKQ